MKLNIIKAMVPAVALLLAGGMSSCMKDLDKGNIDPNAQSQVDINALYSKCYAGLIMEGNDGNADFTIRDPGRSTLARNLFNFNSLPTDEGICWWSDGGIVDICYNKCTPSTETLRFLYYRLVSNISFCNHYIELGQGDATMMAEVRVIRAYNYFLMLDFFGDPSFTTTISPETPKQAHAQNPKFDANQSYTRAELLALGREFMFNWVKDELITAEANLQDAHAKTSDSDADYGRIDKATAWLLLSRLYLNAGTYLNNDGQNNPYWAEALSYAEKVINSSYSLFDDSKMSQAAKDAGYRPYDLLFLGDNGSNGAACEAILPLLQDGTKTRGWGGSMFYIAAMYSSDMTNVIGKTSATTQGSWRGMRLRPSFLKTVFKSDAEKYLGKNAEENRAASTDDREIFNGKDYYDDTQKKWFPRTFDLGDNSDFGQGIVTPKWNNNYSTGATPHDIEYVDIDFFLFRVAEAYLNAAEAEIQLNGVNSSKAKQYMDAIRNRAHAAVKPSYTLQDVLNERGREFFFEGMRRPDLIRFNQYGGQNNYKWEYMNGVPEGARFDKTFNLFPLPSSEIQANSNLTQIDGYSEIQ